jgi:ParB family chromosome partitioning protein
MHPDDPSGTEAPRAPSGDDGALAPSPPADAAGSAEHAQAQAEGHAATHEPRPEAPSAPQRKHHVAPALIPLARVDEDPTFRMRAEGELSGLATDLARLGQLFPVDLRLKPPDRFQIICGFRRVAALRFLQRDRVLARLHTDLSDEDALLMALASAIHAAPVARPELLATRDRLGAEGRLTPAVRDMLEKALATESTLAPETPEEEVDADDLAAQVTLRLSEINQDLALLADVFASLDRARQDELLTQLRYSSELVAFLEDLGK